jgi:hypothetical protein
MRAASAARRYAPRMRVHARMRHWLSPAAPNAAIRSSVCCPLSLGFHRNVSLAAVRLRGVSVEISVRPCRGRAPLGQHPASEVA